jgi:hypothetical protein
LGQIGDNVWHALMHRRAAMGQGATIQMPKTIYCWRCKTDVAMLTEDEWQLVNPETLLEQIKQYRKETGVSLAEAYRNNTGLPALVAYERITGFRESDSSDENRRVTIIVRY